VDDLIATALFDLEAEVVPKKITRIAENTLLLPRKSRTGPVGRRFNLVSVLLTGTPLFM